MKYHLEGKGRCDREYPTFFHTSHPQLAGALRNRLGWKQTNSQLYGSNKKKSMMGKFAHCAIYVVSAKPKLFNTM